MFVMFVFENPPGREKDDSSQWVPKLLTQSKTRAAGEREREREAPHALAKKRQAKSPSPIYLLVLRRRPPSEASHESTLWRHECMNGCVCTHTTRRLSGSRFANPAFVQLCLS